MIAPPPTDEYRLLTEAAGLVRRGGRAVLLLEGGEAAEFLQGQVTNDVEALAPGEGCYAVLLNHKGKLRADMRVLRLAPDRLLLDAEALARAVLEHNFRTYSLGRDVRSKDLTGEREVLSVIGPEARAAVGRLGSSDAGGLAAPPAREHSFTEWPHGLLVSTDLGVDLILDADADGRGGAAGAGGRGEHAADTGGANAAADTGGANAAADTAAALSVPLVSDETAECVRIEHGRPRLGYDMDETTIPQEAGINERAVSFTKGCYVGQETVARLFYKGRPNRHLRGLLLGAPAERGEPIEFDGKAVGKIGSTCVSPTLGPIALALVRREAAPGDEVLVGAGEVPARVVETPFQR